MESILVSIIVPIYNVELYVERCINSIINQTYRNIEIILVNDGSTDKSLEIIKQFEKNDKRIQILNKENGGQASARNLGIEISNGDYLIFVDSDDYLDLNSIRECVKAVNRFNSDLIIFDYYSLTQNKKKLVEVGTKLSECTVFPWNKFYHKKLWSEVKFPEGFWYEDLGIIPIVVSQAINIHKIDKSLYFYDTARGSSQTNTIDSNKILHVIPMLENVYEYFSSKGMDYEIKKEVETLFIEHLLFSTVLNKIAVIDNKSTKLELLDKVNSTLSKYLSNWEELEVSIGNKCLSKYKKVIIKKYLQNNIIVGDILFNSLIYLKKIRNVMD